MKKTFKTIFILGIVASMLFASVSMVFAGNDDVSDFNQLKSKFTSISKNQSVTINLKNDIEIEETIEISVPCKITINGPGSIKTNALQVFFLNAEGIEMYFNNVKIEDLTGNGFSYAGDGEAFYIDKDKCVIEGVEVLNCGSMYFEGDNDFVNAFRNRDGGAIYLNASDCLINKCTFRHCRSQSDGGAIFIDEDDNVIQECEFYDCKSDDEGGAIYCSNYVDDVVINHCKFSDCGYSEKTVGKNVYSHETTLVVGANEPHTDEFFHNCSFQENWSGSFLSAGNIAIIAAGVVVVVAAIIFFTKKKKSAAQN